jgi:hypothetical protein
MDVMDGRVSFLAPRRRGCRRSGRVIKRIDLCWSGGGGEADRCEVADKEEGKRSTQTYWQMMDVDVANA